MFFLKQWVDYIGHLSHWSVLNSWVTVVSFSIESRKSVFICLLGEFYSPDSSMTTLGLYHLHVGNLLVVVVSRWQMCACKALQILLTLCHTYFCQMVTVTVIHCCIKICQVLTIVLSFSPACASHVVTVLLTVYRMRVGNKLTLLVKLCQNYVFWVLTVLFTATSGTRVRVCIR